MGSRVVATVVLVAGIAFVAWVALRTDSGAETATTITPPPATAEPAAAPAPTVVPEATTPPPPEIEPPENFGPRMSLVELDGWLNTDTISSLDDLDGRVVMVEMWTFGCYNCKARIPYNQAYYEEFRDRGFEIVGVHAPEFNYEADVANIKQALVDLGVTWPVALDTNKKNFRQWQEGTTSYWPRTYLIDQNGDIRYDHIGEGKYDELHETIAYLLDNPPPPATG